MQFCLLYHRVAIASALRGFERLERQNKSYVEYDFLNNIIGLLLN